MESFARQALAELAEAVGTALVQYAKALRTATPTPEAASGGIPGDQPRGKRQRQVLALSGVAKPAGMGAVDVAEALGISRANVYQLLNGLVEAGWLEVVSDEDPTHWRLVKAHTTK